jgi:hypothetical protein
MSLQNKKKKIFWIHNIQREITESDVQSELTRSGSNNTNARKYLINTLIHIKNNHYGL